MTTLNLPGRSITYNFPAAGANNGKVASIVDSGETITYQYDALQRLISATGSYGWSQTFASMTAGMPDAFNMKYDAANRMVYSENPTQSRTSEYHCDAGNKRVYEKRFDGGTQEWVYFFGVTWQRLARYTFTVAGSAITFTQDTASVWFGGKLVQKVNGLGSSYAYEDRLGSVGKYLPYGEDKPGASNPANDNEKFATYTRDANTGIDYADQRWHAQGTGRFLTADPYQASAGPGDPGSWNRYGYVQGDPVNYVDAVGLLRENCSDDWATNASSSGPCGYGEAQGLSGKGGNGAGLGCLGPGSAFASVSVPGQVFSYCVAAAAVSPPPRISRYAKSLRLVEDCYTIGSVGTERRRRYEVLDQHGFVLAGPNVTVLEHWDPSPPGGIWTGPVTLNGVWNTGLNGGRFDDHIGRGSTAPGTTGTQFFQAITLGLNGDADFYSVTTLNILEPGGIAAAALQVEFAQSVINANGSSPNAALHPNEITPKCDTPDLPRR